MPTVRVDSDVQKQLRLLGRAWNTSEGDALRRVLDHYRSEPADSGTPESESAGIPIHATYEGNRIEALFDPETHKIQILKGPRAGQSFRSPSGAAIEVVRALKPNVHPNRNGWGFWVVTETGHMLQSIR